MPRICLSLKQRLSLVAALLLLFNFNTAAALVDQNGQTVEWARFKGRPTLANLFFSSCHSACPLLNERLRELAAPFEKQINIISVSVDPKHDTSAVMKKYQTDRGYNLDSWYFLSGAPGEVFKFIAGTLQIKGVDKPFTHSNDILLFSATGEKLLQTPAFSEKAHLLTDKLKELLGASSKTRD